MRRRTVVVMVAAMGLVAGPGIGHARSPLKITEVMIAGKPTPIGGTFAKFTDRPIVNAAGDVLFVADVAGGKARRAIFQASRGTVTKLVAEGDPTPVGGVFKSFRMSRSALTQSGTVVFSAVVAGGKAPQGIFIASKGKVTKIAAHGEPTPAGGKFGEMDDRPSANDDGLVAFVAEIMNGKHKTGSIWNGTTRPVIQLVHMPEGAHLGIFLSSRGTLTKVVATGDPTPLGGTLDGFEAPYINRQGAIVFIGSISGGSVAEAIFVAEGGKLTPVLRAGDTVPDGGKFGKIEDAGINDRGEVPFRAFLEEAKATTGFYLVSQGKITKVAAAGDALPDGKAFEGAQGRPIANGRGAVAFKAQLQGGRRGGSREALYVASQGAIAKIVAEGDPSPVGGTFISITPPSLSEAGAVAFRASIQGGRASEGVFLARQP